MKKLLLGLFVFGLTLQFGLTSQLNAQVIEDGMLPEIEVYYMNYKYLNSVGNAEASVNVKELERKVANYDLKGSGIYQDEYDYYSVNFYIPDGRILAAYDKNGKLVKTIEKFKNIQLPRDVMDAVSKRFPGWSMYGDIYKVNYHKSKGVKHEYKIKLSNGDKKMRIKTDEKGNFI